MEFIYTGLGCFVVGGLVVAFWTSKIWPWIKEEGAREERVAAAKIDAARSALEKKL